ncbi:GAF domain-containing protein [Deinococcus maricopensis]|uniref:Putative GAF sensor protein n=1 Tax=Deinococcus maricopensis (strain DSM 21211 / LMG 22137 / NRRL B-23946 / LB-34) TaxID=709986 RepID=E8U2Z7_DEIML|nr:GAF domain-containing protein [Deinococcus maricopensis]ADV65735.1 putative GAF sensor protein [Deinococcus maricopensis DSM 21211]
MTGAPLPPDESARLLDLARYQVLDTPPEELFDRITRLTARLFRTPVAAINFVAVDRQWAKSYVGLPGPEADRSHSFCAWTVLQDQPLVVPDAQLDPRFETNPMVQGDPHIRLYAGAPLCTPGGHRIGTLCVTDVAPRTLTDEDLQNLQDLAAFTVTELELRAELARLRRTVDAHTLQHAEQRRMVQYARTLDGVRDLLSLPLEPEEQLQQIGMLLAGALGAAWAGLVADHGVAVHTAELRTTTTPPDALQDFASALDRTRHTLNADRTPLGRPVYYEDYRQHPDPAAEALDAGWRAAAWVPFGTWGGVTYLLALFRTPEPGRVTWRESDRALLDTAAQVIRAHLNTAGSS